MKRLVRLNRLKRTEIDPLSRLTSIESPVPPSIPLKLLRLVELAEKLATSHLETKRQHAFLILLALSSVVFEIQIGKRANHKGAYMFPKREERLQP